MIASSNVYTLLTWVVGMIGFMGIAAVIGTMVVIAMREDHGRSVIPWGVRHKVEKARAEAEIEQHRLDLLGVEVKRLALESKRTKVIEALQNGEDVDLAEILQRQLPKRVSEDPPQRVF